MDVSCMFDLCVLCCVHAIISTESGSDFSFPHVSEACTHQCGIVHYLSQNAFKAKARKDFT